MSRLMIVEVPSYSCEFKGIREICELVRCGECKWFDSKGHCMRLTAEYGTYEDVRTDDFCSYGERKGE